MQYSEFKTLVQDTMLRSTTRLLTLETVINAAKRHAQLLQDFEYCRTTVDYTVNLATGVSLASNADAYDASARNVKRVDAARLSEGQSLRVTNNRSYWARRRRRDGMTYDTDSETSRVQSEMLLVQQGSKLFLHGNELDATGTVAVTADVVYFLADYSGDTDTDFFLEEGLDWLLFAVTKRLNFFLKDDERIPLNHELMLESWKAFTKWDSEIATTSDDLDLT